ncbi:MAG: hypothetical protein DI568_17170 [Sphingomonas sp.]|nr:MAG: hypothetical protein DI568_17170 [Sphingomonas sp.]
MDNNSDDTLLTQRQVLAMTGYRSRTSLYRRVKNGTFPKPAKIPQGGIRWRRSELLNWIHSLQLRRI